MQSSGRITHSLTIKDFFELKRDVQVTAQKRRTELQVRTWILAALEEIAKDIYADFGDDFGSRLAIYTQPDLFVLVPKMAKSVFQMRCMFCD